MLTSLVVVSLLYRVMNGWIVRLVSNLPIYDYDTAVWSWRAAAVARFVAVPLAIGWSIAALARGREMIITTLVVGVLMGSLLLSVTMTVQQLIVLIGHRFGSYWILVHGVNVFHLQQGVFTLGVLVGGMMRRHQQMRRSGGAAA